MSDEAREALAGEYVLGVLERDEAASVEARLVSDPALAAAVGRWRDRLNELDLAAPPMTAAPELWGRIEQAIETTPFAREAAGADARKAGLWDSLAFWRGFGLTGGFATAAFAAALAFVMLRPAPAPLVVAVLVNSDMKPGAIVEVFDDNSAKLIPIADVPVPADRALQVWTLPDPATGPVSIGLLPRAQLASLGGVSLPKPKAKQLYEITLEPASGSPTGKPTGPILFKGFAEPPR